LANVFRFLFAIYKQVYVILSFVSTTLLQEHQFTLSDAAELALGEIQNSNTRAMYGKALSDFLAWSQVQGVSPLTSTIVEEHKNFLLSHGYSTATVNQRLAAIRKFAQRAAEEGLVAKQDAAEIFRVHGAKKKPILSEGYSLSVTEAELLLNAPYPETKKGKRDRALLALLIGCGLRRNEIVQSKVEDVLRQEGRWVLAHVFGVHGRERAVPLPGWVKQALDGWLKASKIRAGAIFRAVDRDGTALGRVLSAPMISATVAAYGKSVGVRIAPRDLRRTCAKLCRNSGADLEQIQLLLGHANIQATGGSLGMTHDLSKAPNDALCLRWRGARKRAR
jgi:integrase/recombinase XerD